MNPCPNCGARALWSDNYWYGCDSCKKSWHISNPHPNSPPLALVRDNSYTNYSRRNVPDSDDHRDYGNQDNRDYSYYE